jgi:hypothetical protein
VTLDGKRHYDPLRGIPPLDKWLFVTLDVEYHNDPLRGIPPLGKWAFAAETVNLSPPELPPTGLCRNWERQFSENWTVDEIDFNPVYEKLDEKRLLVAGTLLYAYIFETRCLNLEQYFKNGKLLIPNLASWWRSF